MPKIFIGLVVFFIAGAFLFYVLFGIAPIQDKFKTNTVKSRVTPALNMATAQISGLGLTVVSTGPATGYCNTDTWKTHRQTCLFTREITFMGTGDGLKDMHTIDTALANAGWTKADNNSYYFDSFQSTYSSPPNSTSSYADSISASKNYGGIIVNAYANLAPPSEPELGDSTNHLKVNMETRAALENHNYWIKVTIMYKELVP